MVYLAQHLKACILSELPRAPAFAAPPSPWLRLVQLALLVVIEPTHAWHATASLSHPHCSLTMRETLGAESHYASERAGAGVCAAFAVWTYARVEVQFQWLKEQPPFADEVLRLELPAAKLDRRGGDSNRCNHTAAKPADCCAAIGCSLAAIPCHL